MVRFADPRHAHPYHMHDMILGQPAFVGETLRRLRAADVETFLEEPDYLVVTGCGTSFHAAQYGAYVLQRSWGKRAVVHAVHAFDLLEGGLPPGADAVLGISHSGNTATTNEALKRARRSGARTLGLVGISGSPMEGFVESALVLGSTHDHSWANTMSYTTQLAALAYLAKNAGEGLRDLGVRQLAGLPGRIRTALRLEAAIQRLARRLGRSRGLTFLGAGLDTPTALEAALKIRETCGLAASAYHPEQFLHGPFLSLRRGDDVVALLSREDGAEGREVIKALARAGARVTTIGDVGNADVRLPRMHHVLRPIVSVVPLQFLAYHAALVRKENPDVMRSSQRRLSRALETLFR